jgi:hypothetical protein
VPTPASVHLDEDDSENEWEREDEVNDNGSLEDESSSDHMRWYNNDTPVGRMIADFRSKLENDADLLKVVLITAANSVGH